jgi:hypothetical protein
MGDPFSDEGATVEGLRDDINAAAEEIYATSKRYRVCSVTFCFVTGGFQKNTLTLNLDKTP